MLYSRSICVQARRQEATKHAQALAQLQQAEAALEAKRGEVQQLQVVTSLWGEDEMPEMLQVHSRSHSMLRTRCELQH